MTNLTLLTADKWAGNLFTHFVLTQLPSGAAALKPAFEREDRELHTEGTEEQKGQKQQNSRDNAICQTHSPKLH